MIRTLLKLLPEDHRTTLGGYVALAVLGVMLRAAGAVLLLPLLSALFGEAPATAWPWVGALAGVTALGFLVDWIVSGLGFRIGFSLLEQGQRRLSRALLDVRLDWFDAERSATARQAIAATGPELVGLVAYLFTPLLGALLLPVGIGLFLLPLSWPLGIAALAGCPLLLAAWWGSRRLSVGADRRHAAATGTLTERVLEFARAQEALRAARRVQPARSQVGAALAAEHGATRRLLFMQIPGQLLFSFASQTALILLAGTAVLLGLRGELEAPAAVALLVVIARYLEAFATLGELSGAIGSAATMVAKVRAVLDAPRLSEGARNWRPEAAPRIELKGIRFGHTKEDRRVLEGLDLTLEAGTTTAIVGPSGAGKSTLLGLLAGLHVPEAGSLRVDGVDVTELTASSRRELTSAVFQHPYLFEGTLLENIRVGAPGAEEGAVTEALRLARVEEIVARLPDGGAHRVGEAGSALSGGERQRVTIARALLKPAPILLVDEATSALDTENEQAISRALSADPIPRTRVIVAHRLSSIRHADRVIFLEDGQIVEDGSVEALLAREGRFAAFWRQQEAAATWRMGAVSEAG